MIRAIINIPSTPPIDIAIMGNRGLDEWLGLLAPDCVEEVVGLCCVEEAVASDCVEEAVAAIVEIVPSGPVTVPVIFVCVDKGELVSTSGPTMSVGNDELDWVVCGAPAGLITGAVDPGGQPNAAQGSTKQQPWYPILEHVQYLYGSEVGHSFTISLLVVCWAVERKS